jgi:hypothetical protein
VHVRTCKIRVKNGYSLTFRSCGPLCKSSSLPIRRFLDFRAESLPEFWEPANTPAARSAQARCPLQLSGFGHNIHRPKACETNLDDGVEAPNGAHSDQSQGPFWGVYRSARRMEACHLRRADWHLWVSFPREPQRYHVYPVEPPLFLACHKPQIGGCVFLNRAIARTISTRELGRTTARTYGRVATRLGEAAPLSGPIIG